MFVKRKKPQKIKLRNSIKKERFIFYAKWALKILAASLVIFGIFFALNSMRLNLSARGFFNIEVVKIKGLEHLKKDLIFKELNFVKSMDIFALSKKDIQKKLTRFVEIKTIKVIKYYPNKILIVIKERKPMFWTMVNSEKFCVDQEGVLLNYDIKEPFIFVNYDLIKNPKKYAVLVNLQTILKENFPEVLGRIKEINIDQNFLINLTLKNDTIIQLISLQECIAYQKNQRLLKVLIKKFKFLNIVEENLALRKVIFKSINLRYFVDVDDMIIVKKAGEILSK